MPRYLFHASDTSAGAKGLRRGGGGATLRTTVLLTAEELDAAAQKTITYRPPGS